MSDSFEKISNGIQLPALTAGPTATAGQIWFKNSTTALRLEGMNLELTAGMGLRISGAGGGPRLDVATLVGGTVTVSNTSVTATSKIFLSHQNSSGTIGTLSLGTIVGGTSFVINSTSILDTSDVAYLIVQEF